MRLQLLLATLISLAASVPTFQDYGSFLDTMNDVTSNKLRKLSDQQLDVLLFKYELIRNSWKNENLTRTLFEQFASGETEENKRAYMNNVEQRIFTVRYFHNNQTKTAPEVQQYFNILESAIHTKEYIRANETERHRMVQSAIAASKIVVPRLTLDDVLPRLRLDHEHNTASKMLATMVLIALPSELPKEKEVPMKFPSWVNELIKGKD